MSIETQLHRLNQARESLARVEQTIKDIEAEHQPYYDQRTALKKLVADLETDIRQATLQCWVATGDVPHPATGVRKTLKYRYVPADVVRWVIEKLPDEPDLRLLLTVDGKLLEQEIKAGRVNCELVHPQYEPQPTISMKLGQVLAGGENDE